MGFGFICAFVMKKNIFVFVNTDLIVLNWVVKLNRIGLVKLWLKIATSVF